MYYFQGFTSYWDEPSYCLVSKPGLILSEYYMDLKSKYYYPGNFDSSGVPLYKAMLNGKESYHPTVICLFALAAFSWMNKKKISDELLKKQFLIQADWLVNNQKKLIHGTGWELYYDIDEYSLKSPWISALTQGVGISVLCRAFKINKKEIYISAAENALIPFQYGVVEGGLLNHFEDILIFEEYPSKRANATLNGFIFALLGINDLYLINHNNFAKELFKSGIESLKKLIEYFDMGYWSQYNLYNFPSEYPASYHYHILHIEQMKVLYFLTQDNVFLDYYWRWKSYSNNFHKKNKALIRRIMIDIKLRFQLKILY